jgi:NAD(P)-dependent dehydrogenase (short-subunit alcohol dehydrogenase family)
MGTELGYRGIRVNCIAPAIIKTKFAEFLVDLPEATNNPLQRYGVPEECAGAAAFLLSDDASFINGETMRISGGAHFAL